MQKAQITLYNGNQEIKMLQIRESWVATEHQYIQADCVMKFVKKGIFDSTCRIQFNLEYLDLLQVETDEEMVDVTIEGKDVDDAFSGMKFVIRLEKVK